MITFNDVISAVTDACVNKGYDPIKVDAEFVTNLTYAIYEFSFVMSDRGVFFTISTASDEAEHLIVKSHGIELLLHEEGVIEAIRFECLDEFYCRAMQLGDF